MTGYMDIYRHDLRKAALHESAHVTAATALGYRAELSLREVGNPGPHDKLVVGRTYMLRVAPPEDKCIIGLAGTVAEELDGDDEMDGVTLLDYIECGAIELSGTDAAMAGDYTEDDVDRCIALVREHWGLITRLADAHSDAFMERANV